MVKLNRIYTRTGDDGTTGIVGGERVSKDDVRIECIGTVDEANAAIGVAIVACDRHSVSSPRYARLAGILREIQHDLFDLGADLATPLRPDEKPDKVLRLVTAQTLRLERLIDEFNEPLPPLNSFVLPGGTPPAAALHLARTVTRRAERLAVTMLSRASNSMNAESIRYLNRLSDLLFVLARTANDGGATDVLWVPGANRART